MLKLVEVKISDNSMEEPKTMIMCFDSEDSNCSNYISDIVETTVILDDRYGEFISSIRLIKPINLSTTCELYDKVNEVIEKK